MALRKQAQQPVFQTKQKTEQKQLFCQQFTNRICGNVLQAEEPKAEIRSIDTNQAQPHKIRAVPG